MRRALAMFGWITLAATALGVVYRAGWTGGWSWGFPLAVWSQSGPLPPLDPGGPPTYGEPKTHLGAAAADILLYAALAAGLSFRPRR